MLTRETMTGPWAGLPVAWTDDDRFDEATYRADVARCCEARMPGVYTGGTTGEFYAMEFDEFQAVTRATVEVCRAQGTPVMIGVSSTSTRGAMRRARFAAEQGADAVQVALPFWMEIGDDAVVPFFADVASAAGDLALSVYETTRAKRVLTLAEHVAVKERVPRYLMVKANAETIGATAEGCAALSAFVNVFVGESRWGELAQHGVRGSCSSMVYWNPRLVLEVWSQVEHGNAEALARWSEQSGALSDFLSSTYAPKGFTDTAYDRMGGVAGGFLKTSLKSRAPYPSATPEDVALLRGWYRDHFPEMLQL
jgi:4-hydroxy-tetrahydrodipicolinate synthase